MFDKLIGKDGALWRTGGSSDTDSVSPPPPASATVHSTTVLSASVATLDPEILAQTRKATFEIAGSVYARFATELKKLEPVISDTTTRVRAAVAVLAVNPAEILSALTTTHRAALQSWNATVAKAKDAGHAEKIGGREALLQQLAEADVRINNEITRLQESLRENAGKAATLRQEITSAQAEIDRKAQQYTAASAAVELELNQIITTLQSI